LFHVKRQAALLLILGLASGCGFRPLYGERSYRADVQAQMNAVDIAPIDDRLGQIVRNHLLDAMNPKGTPRSPAYRLEVVLTPTRENLAFRQDEAATRVNLRVAASYVLKRAHSDEVLERGGVRVITSYNVTRQEYATLIADHDAQKRAAREIADEIVSRLAVWFERATQA
jgi:LPS-assembly lipoprotein